MSFKSKKDQKAYAARHYAANKPKYKAKAQTWRQNNRVRHNEIARKHRSTEKGKRQAREYHLRHMYGITIEDYDRMFARQKGVCAICHSSGKLHVDHCHRTQRFRGLLCGKCNRAIGLFGDSVILLARAIEYVD